MELTKATTFAEMRERARKALDEINSIHEGSHVVLALALGAEVYEVYLRHPDCKEDSGYCSRSSNVSDEDDIVIMFAGAGGEVIHRGISWTRAFRSAAGGDWKRAQEPIEAARTQGITMQEVAELAAKGGLNDTINKVATAPKLTRQQVIKTAKVRCLAILRERWDLVLALAFALREKRKLSGDEVKEIVQRWSNGKDEEARSSIG